MKTPDKPQLDIKQLLQAAQLAQIDPATIPSDQTPWSWRDSRAFAWQSAIRALNTAMAEAAEVPMAQPSPWHCRLRWMGTRR